jgi:hypothetical protein
MAQKRKKITPGFYFSICVVCTIVLLAILVPGSGTMITTTGKPDAVPDEVPLVLIKEDSCETLLKSFCVNHGNLKYTSGAKDSKYEIVIPGFGANKAFFYNNNKKLPDITTMGFTIEARGDTLKALFSRKTINGISCVELPSDVLFALMSEHPSIK